jgi:flagellar biosynthesis protein
MNMSSDKWQDNGALSLYYDGRNAPEMAAKGYNHLADLIIEKAKENNILIHKDQALFERLEQMNVGERIPPHMYVVIAELIAFSYVLRGKFPDSWQ